MKSKVTINTKRTIGKLCWLAATLQFALSSEATTLVVTNSADSGPGTLRQLIASIAPGDTITFATNLSGSTITLTNGQLTLSNSVTIDASALTNGIQISGNGKSRIFYVTNSPAVMLTALTIANGFVGSQDGGGGIYDVGSTLTLNQCTLTGNTSTNYLGYGGAIYNAASTVILNQCTLSGNHAQICGGIFNNYGTMALNQCTLTGNYDITTGFPAAGAIINIGSTLTINQSTLTGNYSPSYNDGAGGIYNYSGLVLLTNSIVAGNSAYAIYDADIVTDTGYTRLGGSNIVQHYNQIYGGTFSGTTPLTNAPLLAPLDNYGGLTQTMPPLPGSPAIDAGSDATTNLFATDQRDYPRQVVSM